MTENTIELTRRKILASVGAVGAAGAGVGMGTSALFSDEEGFNDNTITAGTLDLKVDWEEHYSYPQIYGFGDPTSGLSATRSGPGSLDDPVAFPPGVEANSNLDPLLWVDSGDVPAYMDATAIEAFPDEDDNGVQDALEGYAPCSEFADTPGDLDPSGMRTDNADTRTDDETAAPLISLSDVKPGDFGEVTLSAHLCDNPGYLWLTAGNVSASENGITEPEAASDAEEEDEPRGPGDDSDSDEVELLDEIQTAWWYDTNCNNLTDGGTGGSTQPLCVQVVLDASGSMDGNKNENTITGAKTLAANVLQSNSASRVGVTFFSESGYSQGAAVQQSVSSTNDADGDGDVDPQDLDTTEGEIDTLPADGSDTAIGAGIREARDDLQTCPDSHKRVMVVLSNGGENVEADQTVIDAATAACEDDGIEIATIAVGTGADTGFLEDVACKPGQANAPENAFTSTDPADIEQAFEQLSEEVISGGEEIFFQGNLRAALGALTAGDGIPLDGDGGDDFAELGDPADAETRGCFEANTTNCLGFSWWVPTDVGNQIQSDSVEFDLGFYTEQCRNNDGATGNGGTSTSTNTTS